MHGSRLVTFSLVSVLLVTPVFAKTPKKKEPAKNRCSFAYYPIAVGDINEFQMTSNHFDAEKKIVNTISSTYSDEVIAVEKDQYRTKTASEANTSESEWTCSDEGIAMKYAVYPDTKITTTGVTVPSKLEVGGVWNQTFDFETAGSSQKTKTVNRVTKREEVVVPAGTFNAYRVDYEVETIAPDQPPSFVRGTQWLADGFGMVKSVSVIEMEGDVRRVETTLEMIKRTTK